MKYLLLGVCLSLCFSANSQNSTLDNLKKELRATRFGSEEYQKIVDQICERSLEGQRFNNYCEYLKIQALYKDKNYDGIIEKSQAQLKRNKTLDIDEKYSLYFLLQNIYYKKRDIDSIVKYSTKMLEHSRTEDRKLKSLSLLGQIYFLKEDYETALQYFDEGHLLTDTVEDNKVLADFYLQYGQAQYKHRLFNSAHENLNISIHYSEKYGKQTLAYANAYKIKGRTFRKQEKLDSAGFYYKKALVIYDELKKNNSILGLKDDLSRLLADQEKYDEALELAQETFKVKQKLGLKKKMQFSHSILGRLYYLIDKPDLEKSLYHLKEAEKTYSQLNDIEDLAAINLYLGNAYLKSELCDSAYVKFDNYFKLNDSLTKIKRERQFAELEKKYETEKLEKNNLANLLSLQKAEQKNQMRTNQLLIAVICFILALILIYWIRRKYVLAEKRNFDLYNKHLKIIESETNLKLKVEDLNFIVENNISHLSSLEQDIQRMENSFANNELKQLELKFHKALKSKYEMTDSLFRVWSLLPTVEKAKTISEILNIQPGTVKTYCTRLYSKLAGSFENEVKKEDAINLYQKEWLDFLNKFSTK